MSQHISSWVILSKCEKYILNIHFLFSSVVTGLPTNLSNTLQVNFYFLFTSYGALRKVIWDLRKEQDSEGRITAIVGYSQQSLIEKEELLPFSRHKRLNLGRYSPEESAQGVGFIIKRDQGTKQNQG